MLLRIRNDVCQPLVRLLTVIQVRARLRDGCEQRVGKADPIALDRDHLGRYRTDAYGDYLFYAGRLDRLKRLDLAIDAMQRVRGHTLTLHGNALALD